MLSAWTSRYVLFSTFYTSSYGSPFVSASQELQRMANALLHQLFAPGRLLRSEHVRRRRCGEFPSLQGGFGEGDYGTGTTEEVGEEAEKANDQGAPASEEGEK